MKKLINCLAYAANLAVVCVWVYALVWANNNGESWSFLLFSLLMISVSVENLILRMRVRKLES